MLFTPCHGPFFSSSPYSEIRRPHLNFLFLIDDVAPFVSHLTDGRVLCFFSPRVGDWRLNLDTLEYKFNV